MIMAAPVFHPGGQDTYPMRRRVAFTGASARDPFTTKPAGDGEEPPQENDDGDVVDEDDVEIE